MSPTAGRNTGAPRKNGSGKTLPFDLSKGDLYDVFYKKI